MKPSPLRPILRVTLILLMAISGHTRTTTAADSVYTDEECIACHGMGSEESDLHISVASYIASIHGQEAVTCAECHTRVIDDEHQTTEGSGITDCSACHEQLNQHGPNGAPTERPQCHDCHTRHGIQSKTDQTSTVHPDQLPMTCGECHPATTGKTGYFTWFPAFQIASHNKADFETTYTEENCLGCHQGAAAHGESTPINEQTCHKCHLAPDQPGALWGRMHPQADMTSQPVIFAAAFVYQIFFIIGLVYLCKQVGRRIATARSKGRNQPRQ